jgi:hypothetical protein
MSFTYALIIVPSVLFTIYIANVISVGLTVFSSLSSAILLSCYSYAACSDPGVVFQESEHDPESQGITSSARINNVAYIECSQCKINRPCTAMHCYDCGVCVNEVILVSTNSFLFILPFFYPCLTLPSPLLPTVGSPLPVDREVHREENTSSILLLPFFPHDSLFICWGCIIILH